MENQVFTEKLPRGLCEEGPYSLLELVIHYIDDQKFKRNVELNNEVPGQLSLKDSDVVVQAAIKYRSNYLFEDKFEEFKGPAPIYH